MLTSVPMGCHRIVLAVAMCVAAAFSVSPAFADSLDGAPALRESFDPGLQEGLERVLVSLGLKAAVRDGTLAVALADITDPAEPRLAEVNGDEMLYAASLPKIAILLGAFVEIERGGMTLDAATRDSLVQMIRYSSNPEATRVLRRVGKDNLIDILRSDRFRLYDEAVNGGLWVGKEYGKSPAYRRDPLHNLSHGATALQTARFFYLLETGQLLDGALAREMKAVLSKPGINHKFVRGLSHLRGAKIYRKSGTWRHWHADAAMVEYRGHKYIVVALAENADGGRWMARMIRPLHELIVPTKSAGLLQ